MGVREKAKRYVWLFLKKGNFDMKYILKVDEVNGQTVLSEYVDEQGGLWYYAKTSNNRIGKVSKAWITENKADILNLEVLKGGVVRATEFKKEEAKEIETVEEEKPPVKKEVKIDEPISVDAVDVVKKVEKPVQPVQKKLGFLKRNEEKPKVAEVVSFTEDEEKYISIFIDICKKLYNEGYKLNIGPQHKIDSLIVEDEDGDSQIFSLNMEHNVNIEELISKLKYIASHCDTDKILFEFIKSRVKTKEDILLLRKKIKVVDSLRVRLEELNVISKEIEVNADFREYKVDLEKIYKNYNLSFKFS